MAKITSRLRLKFGNESFWAFHYDDLPENQAEVNNHLLTNELHYGDRVEFDNDRNVIRLVKTRQEIMVELDDSL